MTSVARLRHRPAQAQDHHFQRPPDRRYVRATALHPFRRLVAPQADPEPVPQPVSDPDRAHGPQDHRWDHERRQGRDAALRHRGALHAVAAGRLDRSQALHDLAVHREHRSVDQAPADQGDGDDAADGRAVRQQQEPGPEVVRGAVRHHLHALALQARRQAADRRRARQQDPRRRRRRKIFDLHRLRERAAAVDARRRTTRRG